MKRKTKSGTEPRKNRELRHETRLPIDWRLFAAADALKPL